MKFFLGTLLFLMLYQMSYCTFAQNARFVVGGTIEYEKSINMHAQIRRSINAENRDFYLRRFEEFKKTEPQFKILKSTLVFSKDKALFSPESIKVDLTKDFENLPEVKQFNIVHTNLQTKESIIQKSFFDETFLVTQDVRPIEWKVTSETREVAGFECRRANAIIMDSIYVVAFYTSQIPISSGPESFSGLPGMILGVVLPHLNVSWFAKSVQDKPVSNSLLIAPNKGKSVTTSELNNVLKSTLTEGNFKTFGQRVLLFLSL
jgi:GLPGLI family protein